MLDAPLEMAVLSTIYPMLEAHFHPPKIVVGHVGTNLPLTGFSLAKYSGVMAGELIGMVIEPLVLKTVLARGFAVEAQ